VTTSPGFGCAGENSIDTCGMYPASRIAPSSRRSPRSASTSTSCTLVRFAIAKCAALPAAWPSIMNTGSIRSEQ
jgi:hypothetical protein